MNVLCLSCNNFTQIVFLFFSDISGQLEELHDLFQLDPLLLIAFIYISPRAAFSSFIKHTPIYLSINWLFHLIHNDEKVCDTWTFYAILFLAS